MARRILSVWFPQLAIDRWRLGERLRPGEGADGAPLALIADIAQGPRVTSVNQAARTAGVRAGMMLADARAIHPALATAPSDPAGDLAFLEDLALWAQRWGPWSALDPPDGLIVETSGVAHLFGGEAALLDDAHRLARSRGLTVRLALAPTAGAAWALSHYGGGNAILDAGTAPGDLPVQLASLPVAALRLDDDLIVLLRRLGLKRLEDLCGIARESLARRFRNRRSAPANPLIRLDQLLGRVPEPLLPVIAAEVPLVQRRLLEPIRHRELLARVVADLAADMERVLEGKGLGARRLELGMWKVDGAVVVRRLELAAATRAGAHVASLLERRLEDVDAGFGIELVRLRAPWSEPLPLGQRDLEQASERHGTSLATCLDRLAVRLGADAVRTPVPHASHMPERAQRWQPPLMARSTSQQLLEFHDRPLKMLDRPEEIMVIYATPEGLPRRFSWRGDTHVIARAEGPERIAPEWWRERSTARLRDYYRIEDDTGRRYWIYRHGLAGDGRGDSPRWFLQGLYA